MQPAEQTRTRSGGGHTSKGWHSKALAARRIVCNNAAIKRCPAQYRKKNKKKKDDDRGEGHENRWKDDVPRWYKEMGIPMTDVNNGVKERRPIVYPIDADGRRVRLK